MANSATIGPAHDREWVLYTKGEASARGGQPSELRGARSDVVVGIPSGSLSVFAVTLPKTDEALYPSMINAQIEKRGLDSKVGPTLFDFQSVSSSEEGEIFSVTVVVSLPEELEVPGVAGYAPFAMLRSGPSRGAALWMEHGRLVLGVFEEGILIHLQILSSAPEDGNAIASELNLILLGLEGLPEFRSSVERISIASPPISSGVVETLRSRLTIPVEEAPDAVDPKAEARPRLTPTSVIRAAAKKRSGRRTLVILAAGLVVYAVVAAWVWVEAKSTEREIESLEKRTAIVEPDVQHIQMVEERWKQLAPAFDKNLFPVVQLSKITSALPASGVVIREYRTMGRTIRVRGQARDVQLANRLLEDLKGMDFFASYEWSMPNPKVEQNNTATFEIEGKPRYASADS